MSGLDASWNISDLHADQFWISRPISEIERRKETKNADELEGCNLIKNYIKNYVETKTSKHKFQSDTVLKHGQQISE
jgi:hypothetical protein